MQTDILPQLLKTDLGQRANEILRKCVHCGFCTATCPTYQLLGDELDGPRGRIYQVKQLLEGQVIDQETQLHLDRCLTCRSCETTCPSGVNYAELIDYGRHQIERKKLRPLTQRLIRWLLGSLLPKPALNSIIFKLGAQIRPLLPAALKLKTPIIRKAQSYRNYSGEAGKTVLLLEGCVQSTLSPNTNAAAVAVLQALGYRVVREKPASCCGAVNHHLSQPEQTHQQVLQNLQNWSRINQSVELHAIVSSASGCGAMLKDYAKLLPEIDAPTQQFLPLLEKFKDISELFDADTLRHNIKGYQASAQTVAFQAPCSLTHAQRLSQSLLSQLQTLGYQISVPENAHLCCGSAGTYSLLQPALSQQLRTNKLDSLQALGADVIITANVGCEHHLNSAGDTPVIHWVELVANDLQACSST